ncbi:MAG: helix-turn-helix domain-containing protein [Deltaproteobacteria bacterium]|nr:helix-turn-helix domain-containing protein [Deltaproteobacteria bacterium]
MTLDSLNCYRALTARDARFDGVFFVAVSTTGIYCRPICTARTPRRDRCSFYRTPAEAERAGFRACFRCRPELAPGTTPLESIPRLVAEASRHIDEGFLNRASVDELARGLGVTGRHLRRAMEARLGVTPIELAQTRRLALAKQLLQDSDAGLAQIAFASGFGSVRRFNALFRQRFGRAPSSLRRDHAAHVDPGEPGTLALRLGYRPPLDWETMLAFLAGRAIPGVELVADGTYRRTVTLGDATGTLAVRNDPTRGALWVSVSPSLAGSLMAIVARSRSLFDLDASPTTIAEVLGADLRLRPLIERRPGLRVPGAFDPFEAACRAILGQQVTVRAATTLAGRLVARFGTPVPGSTDPSGPTLSLLFPAPARLAGARVDEIASLGIVGARARALVALARSVTDGSLVLDRHAPLDDTLRALEALPGIGSWTAHYLAMRALRWPDAFPAADIAVRKALGGVTAREAEKLSEAWRPWRSYAVLHLWTSLGDG